MLTLASLADDESLEPCLTFKIILFLFFPDLLGFGKKAKLVKPNQSKLGNVK